MAGTVAPRPKKAFPLWGSVGLPASALWGTAIGMGFGFLFGNAAIGGAIGAGLGVGLGLVLFAAAVVSASHHF